MSQVSIWNLALAHVGGRASVVSPSDVSREAELCRIFYDQARRSLLEMDDWSFASSRAALALLETNTTGFGWGYTYQRPASALRVIEVGLDDGTGPSGIAAFNQLAPVDHVQEINLAGDRVILANEQDLRARFTVDVTDIGDWSPLFVEAFGYWLASKIAGPLITGEAGRAESRRLLEEFRLFMGQASKSDANQQRAQQRLYATHVPAAQAGRISGTSW